MTAPTCQICKKAPADFRGVAFGRRNGRRADPIGSIFVCENCPRPQRLKGKRLIYQLINRARVAEFLSGFDPLTKNEESES